MLKEWNENMYCSLHKRPVSMVAFYTKECATCDKLIIKEVQNEKI